MKKVLYTGASLIVAAFLALVVMGQFVDEIEYTATVRVHASMDDTWNTFVDPDRRDEWLEGYIRSEQITGNPATLGAESRYIFEGDNTFVETVTGLEEHQLFTTSIATDLFAGTVTTSFEDQGDAIRLQQRTVMEGATFFWRAALPLFKPLMQRQLIDSLDRLADIAEESPSRPQPAASSDAS